MLHVRGSVREAAGVAVIRRSQMAVDWDGSMKINWRELDSRKQGLYCYAITVKEGAIIRNRAYYHVKEVQSNKTKNVVLDALVEDNLATCFSCGFEAHNNIFKHDLHIKSQMTEQIYKKLSILDFFDNQKIHLLKKLLAKRNFPIENKIIGSKVSMADLSLKNICLYFRCLKDPQLSQCKAVILDLCSLYLLSEDFTLPKGGKEEFLRLIALDFGNDLFKLKFYFQFTPKYDAHLFIKAFEGTKNQNVVEEIVSSNGWIGGLQIATMDNGEISYNFYMKERGASF